MWHILEKLRVQGYQIGYSQRITRGSYKDRDNDKDKDKGNDNDRYINKLLTFLTIENIKTLQS